MLFKPNYFIFCCLFFCFTFSYTSAQQPILFDHLNIEKGLSQNAVLAIAQDQDGFIWLGTRRGLNRYDGYRFKIYLNNPADSTSLQNDYINALYRDRNGLLWVGSDAGLQKYKRKTESFELVKDQDKVSNNPEGKKVTCIAEDRAGDLWIGTEFGLKLLSGKNRQAYTEYFYAAQQGLPSNSIKSIYEDYQGVIWIGTANGLSRLTKHKGNYQFQNFKNNGRQGDISDNFITSIIEDKEKNLWIGTQNGGLNRYDRSLNKFAAYKHTSNPNSPISNVVRKIITDQSGNLWIGSLEGISIMNPKTFSCVSYQNASENKKSLSQNSVYSLFRDKNESIWIGTYFGGVNIAYPYITHFIGYQKNKYESSISNNVVSSLVEDEQKNLWIGTEGGGLNYYNRKTGKYKAYLNSFSPSSLGSNLVKSIYEDKKKNIWIGTHGGGLNLFNPATQTFKRFLYHPEDPLIDEMNTFIEDQQQRLWVGTQKNGILYSNPEKTQFKPLHLPAVNEKLKNKSVYVLLRDQDQRTWIGTSDGLFLLNKNRDLLISFKMGLQKSLKSSNINCIIQRKNGEIWIGTNYGGLSYYDQKNNRFINYTEENGLPNNNVFGLMEDDSGNLWISTSNGVSMFNPVLKTFKNYNSSDGLPGNEFNKNAYLKSSGGELFFGGYNGFTGFFTTKIQTNTKPSAIVLTALKLDNRPLKINGEDGLLKENISQTDELTLHHNQNTITIDFALLNYVKPEKNKYSYQLAGFEKNWNSVNIPTATYTNLPPGDYVFQVKGMNNDGIQSLNIKKLRINILPPFYLTWWAYLFYVCLATGIIILLLRYLLIRAVLKNEKETNAHKLEFFTNISHEIRTPLTLIVAPLEKIIAETREQPGLHKELSLIKNNADRLMRLTTELLDFRKAESGKMILQVSPGNVAKFCQEIFLVFQNMAGIQQIGYDFYTEQEEMQLYFDKIQLEKVLFNLLSNAFKFTPENGQISLYLKVEKEIVKIEIANSGKGIPLENQSELFKSFYQVNPVSNIGTGLGLSFSKSIVELHHGKIYFESTPDPIGINGYTCFTIELQTGKDHFKPAELLTDYVYYDDASNYNKIGNLNDVSNPNTDPALNVNDVSATNDSTLILTDETAASEDLLFPVKKYTILLAEDNAEIRRFVKDALSDNYQVQECEDGLAGWETATDLIPDLIISDVMMPNMDGLEFCRRIKTDERTSHIPVILLTARSAYIHQINGLETGADAYIIKPFHIKLLQLNIENLLSAREKLRLKYGQTITLEPKNLIINTTEQAFLHHLITIIEKHISDTDFDVPALAAEIGMSQPVLYKKIRSLTDQSVNDFIKSFRLKQAARLLKTGGLSISEIAYSVGFNDRKYFSLEFKKQFGISPTEYIQKGVNE
ncbi:ligand-binding sensor domain-containing protein/signal transduction histidine kinase/DNA-binding response OmpR family regulator [Pedobacter cryoconitis]|uniref:hybrid sensor histidine kinase/response regulator n=1 Tax=Pedobacter cryoconitis TaxID=188932 RepID=UPI00160EBD41|nr:hybrid sensor histidine kinase/response regulator transcription factor [Pedobacter cryoconitis]MBB6272381.1 ligand-binding sensor domain-containing protein/signal transduction histidine kinase/DNA-binding response OmpR family regulator [Pedobacter cryoconitis]